MVKDTPIYSLLTYVVTKNATNNNYSAISLTNITKYLFSVFKNEVNDRLNEQVRAPIPDLKSKYCPTKSDANTV